MPTHHHLRIVASPPEERESPSQDTTQTTCDRFDLAFLFREYGGYVATIAYRILGRRDDLEDVVQDVFLAALKGLESVREPEALRSWLATVTVRTTRRRLSARRTRAFLRLDDDDHTIDDYPDPGASVESALLMAPVFRALDTLPVAARMAWSLRYLEGESLMRVAELSRCSLAAVKRRLVKAKIVMDGVVDEL